MQDLDLNKNDSDIDNENEINMTETQELEPINLAPVVSEPALAETSTPNEPSAFSNNYAEIKIEAAAIREWREQNDKRIQEADEKEHEAKQQMLADARRELEEWKQSRNDNLEKTKIRNRIHCWVMIYIFVLVIIGLIFSASLPVVLYFYSNFKI